MEIFNVQIFGSDKEQWLEMSVEDKVEWIRKYTNQQEDAIIEEFINNPKISKDKICLTCRVDKYEEEVVLYPKDAIVGIESFDKQFTESTGIKIPRKSRKK